MTSNRQSHLILERSFSQADFDAFADLSGDDNPIHVDPAFSSRTRFGRTVAHGMLLYTVLRGLTEKLVPGARHISQDLKFPAPTFANELVEFEVAQLSQSEIKMTATRTLDGTIVCEGVAIVAAPETRAA